MALYHNELRINQDDDAVRIDEDSMKWIYNKYFRKLAFYARGFLSDEEKARDAVFDMLVVLWEKKDKVEFKNERALQGYLYAVTRNKAINLVREVQQDRLTIRALSYWGETSQYFEEAGPEVNGLPLTEAIDFIPAAIGNLSPAYQSVVTLTLEGKSHEEIAEKLKISQDTVRTNKMRGLIALRKKFEERFRGELM